MVANVVAPTESVTVIVTVPPDGPQKLSLVSDHRAWVALMTVKFVAPPSLVLHVYGSVPPLAVNVTVPLEQPIAVGLVGETVSVAGEVEEEADLCLRIIIGYATGLFLSSATSIYLPFCPPKA